MKRLLVVLSLLLLMGCKQGEAKVVVQKSVLLENTLYATEVYHYKTNKPGSKVVIIGGIHGDEIAGYKAAEKLIDDNPFTGEVLLIPRANILATQLNQRYPGSVNKGEYEGVIYSDLNRSMPGDQSGTVTQQIAWAFVELITEFDPTYIIDLHESLRSYKDEYPRIGDSLIYSNKESAWIALQVLEHFNDTYLETGDVVFRLDNSAPSGSFNNYFGSLGYITLTIETNRQLSLTKRTQQQLDLVTSFFHVIQS